MTSRILSPADLLVPGRVLLDVSAQNKKRVFEEISLAFENSDGPPRGKVFKSLLERERLGSTIISDGVAIPHARITSLKQPLAAYLRMLEPVQFDLQGSEIKHMFILLVPENADDTHLKILSVMSRMLTDRKFIEGAEGCSHRADFLQLVADWTASNLPAIDSVAGASG